jgi:hypothetical protein
MTAGTQVQRTLSSVKVMRDGGSFLLDFTMACGGRAAELGFIGYFKPGETNAEVASMLRKIADALEGKK